MIRSVRAVLDLLGMCFVTEQELDVSFVIHPSIHPSFHPIVVYPRFGPSRPKVFSGIVETDQSGRRVVGGVRHIQIFRVKFA